MPALRMRNSGRSLFPFSAHLELVCKSSPPSQLETLKTIMVRKVTLLSMPEFD